MVDFDVVNVSGSNEKKLMFSEIAYVKDLYDWIEQDDSEEGWVQFLFDDSEEEMASFAYDSNGKHLKSSIYLTYKYRQLYSVDFAEVEGMGRVYKVRIAPVEEKDDGLQTSVCYSYNVPSSNIRIFSTLIGKVAGRECMDIKVIKSDENESSDTLYSIIAWLTLSEHAMVSTIMRLNGFEFEESE